MNKYFDFLKEYSKEERRQTQLDPNANNERDTIVFNEDIEQWDERRERYGL